MADQPLPDRIPRLRGRATLTPLLLALQMVLDCMLDTAKETPAAELGRTLSNVADKNWRLSAIEDECKQAELKQLREVPTRPCHILPGSILT